MKNFYCLPLLLFVLFVSFTAASQNTVQGLIVDQNKNPVAFANVVLFEKDSITVYRGAVSSEDGVFIFEDIKDDVFVLSASFVGYDTYRSRIEINGNTSLQDIVLQENAAGLDEVTVNSTNPTVIRSVDRLIFNVENTTLSTGSTYELLKRTPGVIESQGQLMVKNRPAVVYINDRRVYLTQQELQQLLEGYSGANIKSVEVITNPPAKYDAEGGAIINIVTSKNLSIGYKGSINAAATYAIVPKYTVGTSQYYKNDWVNIFAGYNYNNREDYENEEGRIFFFQPDQSIKSRWFNDFERNVETRSHSFNTIIDFTLSEKSSLSFSANLLLTPESSTDLTGRTEVFNSQFQPQFFLNTDSQLENEQNNVLLSSTFTTALGEKGATFSAEVNYINYDEDKFQDLETEYFSPNNLLLRDNSFSTVAGQNSDIYTGKIDITSPWGNSSIETGLKFAGISSASGLFFYDTNGPRQLVPSLTDEFEYEERIYAGYFSWTREWEKWSVKGGLRGEYTDVDGISVSLGKVNTQQYFKLFPTFYFMHVPNENHTFAVDYSRRIVRPRFQSLNPFRYFINENNFNVGNPNLMPSFSNKINFNYTYKNKLAFDLYWDRQEDAIATLPFQDNVNELFRSVTVNMNHEQQVSLDISFFDYVKEWWYLYVYTSFFYTETNFTALESGNREVVKNAYSTFLQAQNFITLSKDRTFSAELTASYLPQYITGSYTFDEPQYILSFGLRKTFFNNRLVTTVNVDDIFNSTNVPLSSQYLNQDNSFFEREAETRRVRFGLIYKFGNFRLRDNSRAIDAEESQRLVKE